MKVGNIIQNTCLSYKAPRIVSTIATGFRMAQYPSGALVMQGAYRWDEGFKTGWEWKDLPVVMVNVHGQVPNDD